MLKTLPLFAALALLTACGGGEGNSQGEASNGGGVQGAGKAGGSGNGGRAASGAGAIPASGPLTGLYESKSGGLSSQLCIVDRGEGAARFGLNIWGGNMHSCSGAGTVARKGGGLTLTMAGDRSCVIEARIDGDAIRLPAKVPEGCTYYCGARAQLTGISLTRTGKTEADALKARDVVDEPLCDASRGG
jgi:hypothetical protein